MISPTRSTEQLLFTTVRIEMDLAAGGAGSGTGFFFDFKIGEHRTLPVIITNRHVVNGAVKGRFQLHESRLVAGVRVPTGTFFTSEFDEFETRWIPHPQPQVDLCAMLFQPVRLLAEQKGKSVFTVACNEPLLPSRDLLNDLGAVEDLLMVGYPNGLWDETNNLPVIRKGVTSSHPAMDYRERPEFVMDVPCFPGSSGSPVFLAQPNASAGNEPGSSVLEKYFTLMGVFYAGPALDEKGQFTRQSIPVSSHPGAGSAWTANLGYVIKARELLVLGARVKQVLREQGLVR